MQIPNWILWKYATRNGKTTKIPITVEGKPASIHKNMITFEEAFDAWWTLDRGEGLGFVFTEEAGIVGIDLDHCVDDDRQIQRWALEHIKLFDSYTEISPSGHGIHILIRANFPHGRKIGDFEIYGKSRFFTVSWDVVGGRDVVMNRQEELNRLVARFRKSSTRNRQTDLQSTKRVVNIQETL